MEMDVNQRLRTRYGKQDLAFRTLDALTGVFCLGKPGRNPPEVGPRPRILLCNLGHLGDGFLTTVAVNAIRAMRPEAHITLLARPAVAAALAGHPGVDEWLELEHWHGSRSRNSRCAEWRRYRKALGGVVRRAQAVPYDFGIDLHAWMPSAIWPLWRMGMPRRLGYTRMGGKYLLTDPVDLPLDGRHETERMLTLLGHLDWGMPVPAGTLPSLPPPTVQGQAEARTLLAAAGLGERPYLVLHPGASTSLRDWPLDSWLDLAQRLRQNGYGVVVTGAGDQDLQRVGLLQAKFPWIANAVGRLAWPGFFGLLRGAAAVVSVETAAGHAAAAAGVPCVSLHTGMSHIGHWRPLGPRVRVLSMPVPCAPCFNTQGCPGMDCIRTIPVKAVLEALEAVAGLRLMEGAAPSRLFPWAQGSGAP